MAELTVPGAAAPRHDMDLSIIGFHLSRLAIAFVLALPVAWDRERAERTLGLRTFPLVAMASAGYLLVARASAAKTPARRRASSRA